VTSQGVGGDKPGRMGFKLGLTIGVFLVGFGSEVVLVLGEEVVLFFFSLALVFGGTRLLLTPSRPRFMMLAGVTGAIVSSASAKSSLFGSPLGVSLGGGDGLACGGMEKSWPDKLAPVKFEVMVVGVEVADLVARFRTTTEAIDDLRLGAGLLEESSSPGEALRLLELEMAGTAGCWV
jgi:hypothetical protein